MGRDGGGGRRLGRGIGRGVRRCPWTRRDHHKAHRLLRAAPCTRRHRHRSQYTVPMPAAGLRVLGPSGLCSQEGQGGWPLAPCGQRGTDRPGAWHQGDHAQPLLPAEAPRPAPRGLAVPSQPLDTRTPKMEALLESARRLHTSARMPIPAPPRRGTPPSPRPPRRRRTGLRAARPSWRGPEAGRGAPGVSGASPDAP
jgi:hypothetical protein